MDSQIYIKKIDDLFSRSRKYYNKFFFERSVDNNNRCHDIIGDQLSSYNTYNSIHKWFKDELVQGFANKDSSYINFCEGVFNRQFKFIEKFTQAMHIYVEDGEAKNNYLKRYNGIDTRKLEDNELLLGMQTYFILGYSVLESIVDEFAYSYKSLMPVKDIDFSYQPSSNHIRLDYGMSNEKALIIIYEALKMTYIDNTFEEFSAHFKVGRSDKKIKFIGTNANIVNLFFGVTYQSIDGIKISNSSKLDTIITHFENKNGMAFNYRSLESQSQKPIKNPREFEKIKTLLIKLKGLE